MDSRARSRFIPTPTHIGLLLTIAALAIGGMEQAAGQTPPPGEAVMAWHVTIAPSWSDPSTAPPQITPFGMLYAIHDAPDGTIVMIEKWTSVRELDDHGVGEAVRALNASMEGRLASPVEVTRLVPLPAGTEEQGQL